MRFIALFSLVEKLVSSLENLFKVLVVFVNEGCSAAEGEAVGGIVGAESLIETSPKGIEVVRELDPGTLLIRDIHAAEHAELVAAES